MDDRWQRIRSVFHAVADLPEEFRAAALDRACAHDTDLRAEVEGLLNADAAAGALLSGAASEFAPSLVSSMASTDLLPGAASLPRVEGYRVIREIGRGGMGAVYLAERASAGFEQRVALKLLRNGLDGDGDRRRFLAERQILAALSHPGIAHLFDGGVTADGVPYLAMEYVDGVPITQYCDERRLPIEQRIALFRAVATAVQHAHRNLIVHRDLKPSNILVRADGTVKLLDFGIAKLIAADPRGIGSPSTRTDVRRLTPEYASPEQVGGDPVTTASDIYQLGLLFYELLTGRRPLPVTGASAAGVERIIREREPIPPSEIVLRAMPHQPGHSAGCGREALAAARRTTPPRLQRRLRGDLDAIVLQSLRKEPERRYPSVEALLDDVDRHATGLPLRARPDTRRYRAWKFLRRNPTASVAAALILFMLVGYAVSLRIHGTRMAAALARSELEAAKSEQLAAFMIGLFEAGDPDENWGLDLTVRELLDRGARRADALAHEPELHARLLEVIGTTHLRLAGFVSARRHLERSHAIREELYDDAHPELARSRHDLGRLLAITGELDSAESLLLRAAAARRTARAEPADLALTLFELARLNERRGEADRAETLYREALTLQRETAGVDGVDLARTLDAFGLFHWNRGNLDAAEPLLREAVQRFRASRGEHTLTATALNNLALVLMERERYDEAEEMLRAAIAIGAQRLGAEHPQLAARIHNLGIARREQGAHADADSLLRRALELTRNQFGDAHARVSHFLISLARNDLARGEARQSEQRLREALAIGRQVYPSGDWRLADAEGWLGMALLSRGRVGEAAPLIERSARILEAHHAAGHRRTREALARLAALYAAQGRHVEHAELSARLAAPRLRAAAPD